MPRRVHDGLLHSCDATTGVSSPKAPNTLTPSYDASAVLARDASIEIREQKSQLYRRQPKCFGGNCFPRIFGSSRRRPNSHSSESNVPQSTKQLQEHQTHAGHEDKTTQVAVQQKSSDQVQPQKSARLDASRTGLGLPQQHDKDSSRHQASTSGPEQRSSETRLSATEQHRQPPSPGSLQKEAQKGPALTLEEQRLLQGVTERPPRARQHLPEELMKAFEEESVRPFPYNELLQAILDDRRQKAGLGEAPRIYEPGQGRNLRPHAHVFLKQQKSLRKSDSVQSPAKTPREQIRSRPILTGTELSQPTYSSLGSSRSSVYERPAGLDLRPRLGSPTKQTDQPMDSRLHLQLLPSTNVLWNERRIAAENDLRQQGTRAFDLSNFIRLAKDNVQGSEIGSSPIKAEYSPGLRRTQSELTSGMVTPDRTSSE